MTERGLPIVDGATACPFVAFEDDRDERSTRPDHRHRCYAEVRPATRALAHQEAYCLSSSFPACPTFQDWARREAARARAAAPSVRDRDVADLPPPRMSRRDWAAPPPWAEESAAEAGGTRAAGAAGVAGAAAGAAGFATGAGAAPPGAPPAFLSDRDQPSGSGPRPSGPPVTAAGAGLAEAAAGLADADAITPVDMDDVDWYHDVDPDGEPDSYITRSVAGKGGAGRARRPSVGDTRRQARSPGGPSWERPHRYEAYPTLRTRVGLPNVPRVAVAFAALVVTALLLFFIPPMLINPGGGTDPGRATPTPSIDATASALAPTPIPSPTPQVYVIASGDILSTVAKRFGITLNDLLAANPSITNPDKISIGQEIVIPLPAPSEIVDNSQPDASTEPSVAP